MSTPSQYRRQIDTLTQHLDAGLPIFVSGFSGMGKTALTLEAARACNLRPVLFEALEDRDVANDEVVLIEDVLRLTPEDQNALLGMLRTPKGVEAAPRMERLRNKPLVIMATTSSEPIDPSSQDADLELITKLRHTLPNIRVKFDQQSWAEWAIRNNLPTAAIILGYCYSHLFYRNSPALSLTPSSLEKIARRMPQAPSDLIDRPFLETLSMHLRKGDASSVASALYEIQKSIVENIDLDALASLSADQSNLRASDMVTAMALPFVLGMAATDETLAAYAAHACKISDSMLFAWVVETRGKCSAEAIAATFDMSLKDAS